MEAFENRPLRVLAADDSAVMRGIIRTLFLRHSAPSPGELPGMELIGVARDGVECLEAVERLKPDALVLDLEMPRLSGLEVLDRLRACQSRLPVIMCSSHTERGARATFDALARGASDYVMKPAGQRDVEAALTSLAQQLLPRIAALVTNTTRIPSYTPAAKSVFRQAPQLRPAESSTEIGIVVIGVSTGGPAALEQLLPQLPADLPVPVMIVQHMPKLFTGVLADRLNRCCQLKVAEAVHGVPLRPGTIWLAPGDAHMEVMQQALATPGTADLAHRNAIAIHWQPPRNHYRPSVDYLFLSAARLYGAAALAIVLTGMGSDGLDGARAIHSCGGVVLAQDEASSAVWGMPGRVAESGIATSVLPLSALAREVIQRVQAKTSTQALTPFGSLKASRQGETAHGLL